MPPAARITDFHECPMQTPAPVPIPHVGGPVSGPCEPTVLIGGLPAARVGDMLICVGPPDAIVKGSSTVMIGGVPAARMGDQTAHGGQILLGALNVMIGG
ncbi:MAG: PAAR domain-containing protein [Bacteroidetes bacterium]|nr:PAAR domain-containing protein [Bacteroidota bacterium]